MNEPQPATRPPRGEPAPSLGRGALAVLEALGVLLACLIVVAAGTGLIAGFSMLTGDADFTAEIPLVDVDPAAVHDLPALAAEIESGLDGVTVMVRGEGDAVSLQLDGLPAAELPEPDPRRALEDAGYVPGEPTFTRSFEPAALQQAVLVPALLIQVVAMLGAGWAMMRLRARRAVDGVPKAAWPAACALGALGGLVAFGVSVGLGALQAVLGVPIEEQAWVLELFGDRQRLLALSPLIVVLVPLSEEVFFRGYMLRFVSGRGGVALGLIVSSLLFSLLHLNWTGLLIYFAVGAMFGLLCLRTRHLGSAVVAHMVYNGLVLAAGLLTAGR